MSFLFDAISSVRASGLRRHCRISHSSGRFSFMSMNDSLPARPSCHQANVFLTRLPVLPSVLQRGRYNSIRHFCLMCFSRSGLGFSVPFSHFFSFPITSFWGCSSPLSPLFPPPSMSVLFSTHPLVHYNVLLLSSSRLIDSYSFLRSS